MIINPYTFLDGFVTLLRLGLAGVVSWLAFSIWAGGRWAAPSPEERTALEARSYLLYLLAGLLLALNVLSWPIFYLLLQSYVTEWPGLMCIYGVTRVGSGSHGLARFLPPLLAMIQAAKPLVVFLSGAWFALYLVNRITRTSPLTGRIVFLVLVSALLAGADAAAELTYLVLPKKEEFVETGCCTALFDVESGPSRFVPQSLLGDGADTWLHAAYYAVNVGLILALVGAVRACRSGTPTAWLAPLFGAALLSLLANAAFLTEIAAPRLIRMPAHHCLYDLIPLAPRSLVAITLGLGGSFLVGWGCVVGWLGGGPESGPSLPHMVANLFRLAALGHALSLLFLSVELAAT